ncbi:MAG: hypothetical protein SPI16_00280 [Porphyromonas sp.]|nr:hypothetical protein [Porphyromonas sp.]MDY6101479.1 hypothetical protein [Porphyromonas sp.]
MILRPASASRADVFGFARGLHGRKGGDPYGASPYGPVWRI